MLLGGWVVVVWDQSAADASIKDIAKLSIETPAQVGGLSSKQGLDTQRAPDRNSRRFDGLPRMNGSARH